MASTPDPSYWGNPPETPRSKYDPRNQQPYAAPQQAYGQQPAQEPQPQNGYAAAPQQPADQPFQQSAQQQPYAAQPSQPQQTYDPNRPEPYGQQYNPNNPEPYGQQPYQASNPNAAYSPIQTDQPKKKGRTIAIVVGIIAVVVLFFGIAGCVAVNTISNLEQQYEQNATSSTTPDSSSGDSNSVWSDSSSLNESARTMFGLSGEGSFTTDELNSIQSSLFNDASKSADENGNYPAGVYFVGTDISAGSYWFEGSDNSLSYFFVFDPASESGSYDVEAINSYYGHNLMELEEGQVLILVNYSTMISLEQMSETFSSPYTSGVYRVGTDIPAGTYTLGFGSASDYSAYYVMTDLEYNSSSYKDTGYFVPGDSLGTITLEEGTYIELYNMTLTSNQT